MKEMKTLKFPNQDDPYEIVDAYAREQITSLPSVSYVDEKVASLVNSAPEKLNTLDELAAALGDDENFANTVTTELSKKVNASELLQLIYPVGSIYMSVNNVSPSTFLGGIWVRIKDTFLLSAGDTYEAGSVGGEAEHTLTIKEMPSVTGEIVTHGAYNGTPIHDVTGCFSAKSTVSSKYLGGSTSGANSISRIGFNNGGQNQAHNNMPPYLSVYMWKRTS